MKFRRTVSLIATLPRRLLITFIRLYQMWLSPFLGRQCRFVPTCSNYFLQAVEKHGAVRGSLMGIWRLVRCNPLSKGGFDPVK
ncbi:MAG: membrane protein insertion efficiency factor YidD [Planctomycetota bacterium]